MQRIVHAQFRHALGHQPVRRQHDRYPRGFERDDQIAETLRLADLHILESALHHALGRIAVHDRQALGQASRG